MMQDFVLPDYKELNITNVLPSSLNLIQNKKPKIRSLEKFRGVDKAIVFLVDGLRLELLNSLSIKEFELEKITSVFPTTTASAITSFITCEEPIKHGIPEMIFYSRKFKNFVDLFNFSFAGETQNSLYFHGIEEKDIIRVRTFFEKNTEINVKFYSFLPYQLFNSAYTNMTTRGSLRNYFLDYVDLFQKLKDIVEEKANLLAYVYFDNIDIAQHKFGVGSEEEKNEFLLFYSLLRKFLNKIKDTNTLVVLTSDHGQISMKGKVDLSNISLLDKFSLTNPYGSSRVLYFLIRENKLQKVKEFLEKKVGKKAFILTLEEAIKSKIFGTKKPSKEFLDRVGNLLLIAKNGWEFEHEKAYYYTHRFHGALTPEEVYVPLLANVF